MIYISYVLDVMLIHVLLFWIQYRAFSIIFLLTYNASALKIFLFFYISPYTRSPCTSLRSKGYLIALWLQRKCTAHMFNCFPVVIQSCCTIMDHKNLWKTHFSYLPNFVILRHPTTKLLAKHRGMSIFSQSMDTKLLTPIIIPYWSPPSPPSSMLIYARHKCETGLKIWGSNIESGGRGVF